MQRHRLPFSGTIPVLTLAVFLATGGAWAQSDSPSLEGAVAPDKSPSLDAIQKLVRDQRKLIEKQEKTIDALKKRLDDVESLALSSHNRLEEMHERAPDAEVGGAVEERLAELEASIQELPEKADVVSAGEFPGSFRIPGTDAAMKIGGQVRFTGVNSFDAIGSEDRFVTSSIPIEDPVDRICSVSVLLAE